MMENCRVFGVGAALCLCVGASLASAAPLPAPEPHYLAYTGTATAPRTQDFLYGESHVLLYRDGRVAERVVLYTCRDGTAFARKTVSYVDPLAPDFRLEDASNGMLEGVRTEGGARAVFFRSRRADEEKSSTLPPVQGLVADTGFDEFVHAHWQALLDGQTLSMRFLVPSRMQDIGFQVQHVRTDSSQRDASEVFRLKLAGPAGWVLPGIDVYYGATDHVLMRYVGLSDLRDPSNNNFQAEIVFHPDDRKPTGEQAIDSARRVPLTPCK